MRKLIVLLFITSLIYGLFPGSELFLEILFYTCLLPISIKIFYRIDRRKIKAYVYFILMIVLSCLPLMKLSVNDAFSSFIEFTKLVYVFFVCSHLTVKREDLIIIQRFITLTLFFSVFLILLGYDWHSGFITRQGRIVMYSEGMFAGSSTSLGLLLIPVMLLTHMLRKVGDISETWYYFSNILIILALIIVGARAALLFGTVLFLTVLYKNRKVYFYLIISVMFTYLSNDILTVFRYDGSDFFSEQTSSGRLGIFSQVFSDFQSNGVISPRGREGSGLLKSTNNIHNQWLRIIYQSGLFYTIIVTTFFIYHARRNKMRENNMGSLFLLSVFWLGMFEPFVLLGTPRMAFLPILLITNTHGKNTNTV